MYQTHVVKPKTENTSFILNHNHSRGVSACMSMLHRMHTHCAHIFAPGCAQKPHAHAEFLRCAHCVLTFFSPCPPPKPNPTPRKLRGVVAVTQQLWNSSRVWVRCLKALRLLYLKETRNTTLNTAQHATRSTARNTQHNTTTQHKAQCIMTN